MDDTMVGKIKQVVAKQPALIHPLRPLGLVVTIEIVRELHEHTR